MANAALTAPLTTVAPPAEPAPFIDRYLAYLLARASHRVSSGFHALLAERGLAASTWRIVASLQAGPLAVGELAQRVLLAQPTLSKALDRLEQEQLVSRARDPDNRRSVAITLTAAGRQLGSELIPLANHYEAACFDHMSDAERSQLVALLQKAIG